MSAKTIEARLFKKYNKMFLTREQVEAETHEAADKIDSSSSVEDTWLIADVARFVAKLGEKNVRTKQQTIEYYTQRLQDIWRKQSR
ncbi:MAG TPA: hypothetical protein PLV58_06065 [Campylobacterales bacterium]|nr:hypothetical protein [Campylobacterales bacterium]